MAHLAVAHRVDPQAHLLEYALRRHNGHLRAVRAVRAGRAVRAVRAVRAGKRGWSAVAGRTTVDQPLLPARTGATAGAGRQAGGRPRHTSLSSTSRIRAEKMPLPDLAPLPSGVAYDCSVNDEAFRRGIHL